MNDPTPAHKVIRLFGGAAKLGKKIGVDRSQVSRWRWPKSRGGCDGLVPARHHVKLLQLATDEGLSLSKNDLIPWLSSVEDAA